MILEEFIELLKTFPQDWQMEFTCHNDEYESWQKEDELDVHQDKDRKVIIFSMYS